MSRVKTGGHENTVTGRQGDKVRSVTLSYDAIVPVALTLASLALYLRTLAPDVVEADGGEFQFAAWNFSFVHPTGYPLYLILGGMFQHLLPLGNPAYRLNLFTALTAALAVAVLYFVVKELTQRPSAALVGAAAFALSRMFWFDASAAETYDFNALLLALLILIALRWQAAPQWKTFAAFCFVYGLALTHHRTIILWIPAFALFFLFSLWQSCNIAQHLRGTEHATRSTYLASRFTFYLFPLFAFLLPLALYLYIPLRAPASPYAVLPLAPGRELVLYDNSFTGFVNYILGRAFQSEIGWDAVSVTRLTSVPVFLLNQFGILGLLLGIVGWGAMVWRKEWARLVLLSVGFVTTILFASIYHIGDISHYYIPAYLVWAISLAAGFAVLVAFLSGRRSRTNYVRAVGGLALLSVLALAFQLVTNLPLVDRSHETTARDQWTRILAAPIPPTSILLSNDRDEMMPLWYMQYVENKRRDLLGLFPLVVPYSTNIVRLTDALLDTGRPVFFVKPMPGIEIKYRLADAPPLVQVLGSVKYMTPQFSSDAILAEQVRVLGYDLAREQNSLRVAVYWQSRAHLNRDYTTFVHLLDAHGDKIAQGNDHQVGGAFYPTSQWLVGETLRDEQIIPLPPNLALGDYRLVVGMYAESDSIGEPVDIGKLKIGD